ncbi:MAG: NADH-quinone oxidoreductase subunit D, partial [Candidatus Aminicenantes bacterium]|nr:NADH-quinone oxidoreductase subunit D [Candidatus Aminicenantes bacterium]
IMLELDGEKILNAELEVGYLHRGFEKICEHKTYFNLLPYTDRMNYVSPLLNNLAYVMTMEKMLELDIPQKAQYIRVMLCEMSRISDHLTALAAMTMECGAFTVFLYLIKAREYLWEAIEFTTGARMTTSYIRIGGVKCDLHPDWVEQAKTAVLETKKVLKDVHGLMDKNKIWLQRTRNIAVVSPEMAINYGWTGPCLRSTGVAFDLRKAFPYSSYDHFDFEVPVGEQGDNYDRYTVRMKEMEQSLRIIEQCVEKMPSFGATLMAGGMEPVEAIHQSRSQKVDKGIRLSPNLEGSEKERYPDILAEGSRSVVPPKEDTYTSIEGLISHFKFFMKDHGIRPPKGEVYFAVEGGNGELGFYIVSDGTDKPYRLHVRAPCFHIVSALEEMITGHMVADIIPTFGSTNMIGGEFDR